MLHAFAGAPAFAAFGAGAFNVFAHPSVEAAGYGNGLEAANGIFGLAGGVGTINLLFDALGTALVEIGVATELAAGKAALADAGFQAPPCVDLGVAKILVQWALGGCAGNNRSTAAQAGVVESKDLVAARFTEDQREDA